MALRFMDSFDHYSTNELIGSGVASKWSGGLNSYKTVVTITAGGGRYQNCLSWGRASSVSSWVGSVYKTFDNQPTWIVGFAFRTSSVPNNTSGYIVQLYDGGTTQCELRLNSDGTLSVTRTSTALTNSLNSTTKSTAALTTNTWYYIEWMCTISASISAHSCMVNVNGVNTNWLDISTAQNTKSTANTTANQVVIGPTVGTVGFGGASTWDMDDLYICDSTGAANNTFLGDTRVECRLPLTAGTNTDWAASGGFGVACVNEPYPDGDTSFISSSTTNQISTFTVASTAAVPASIAGMQMIHCSKKTDAGTRQIADELRSGGTNYAGTTQNLSTDYNYYMTVYEKDPATTAAWTSSAANAVEIGVKEIA